VCSQSVLADLAYFDRIQILTSKMGGSKSGTD
jgi:hypothetical protein